MLTSRDMCLLSGLTDLQIVCLCECGSIRSWLISILFHCSRETLRSVGSAVSQSVVEAEFGTLPEIDSQTVFVTVSVEQLRYLMKPQKKRSDAYSQQTRGDMGGAVTLVFFGNRLAFRSPLSHFWVVFVYFRFLIPLGCWEGFQYSVTYDDMFEILHGNSMILSIELELLGASCTSIACSDCVERCLTPLNLNSRLFFHILWSYIPAFQLVKTSSSSDTLGKLPESQLYELR